MNALRILFLFFICALLVTAGDFAWGQDVASIYDDILDLHAWDTDSSSFKKSRKILDMLDAGPGNNARVWELKFAQLLKEFEKECDNPEMKHIVLGVVASHSNNWSRARDQFGMAIVMSSESANGYILHAMACYQLQDWKSTLASATTYMELRPESQFAKQLVYQTAMSDQDYRTAHEVLSRLLDESPNNHAYQMQLREFSMVLLTHNEALQNIIDEQAREIQRLRAKVRGLEKENASLRSEVERLKKKIARLAAYNRNLNRELSEKRVSGPGFAEVTATIIGLLVPYKPVQMLCAAISLLSG